MGARSTRVVVPPVQDGEPIELTEEQVAKLLEAETPDAGDLEHLASVDASWRWSVYRRLTTAEKVNYPGEQRAWITNLEGPVDIPAFQLEWGGGTFDFFGRIAGEKGLKKRDTVSLRGPLKPLIPVEPPAPPAPAAAPAAAPGLPPELIQILTYQHQLLTQLAAKLEAKPAQEPLTFENLLKLAAFMRGGDKGPDVGALQSQMVEMFKSGIELGATGEGGGKSTGERIAELVVPALERVATNVGAALAAKNRRAAAPAARPASEAEVIGTAPLTTAGSPAPAAATPTTGPSEEDGHRWMTLIASLRRGIDDDVDPGMFADTIEVILEPDEIKLLAGAPDEGIPAPPLEAVMSEILSVAGPHQAALSTEKASHYVAKVLEELRAEPEVG